MKTAWIFLPLLLAAQEQSQYLFAFAPDRHSACEAAKAELLTLQGVVSSGGCACEKVDYEGWRCVVRHTLKATQE